MTLALSRKRMRLLARLASAPPRSRPPRRFTRVRAEPAAHVCAICRHEAGHVPAEERWIAQLLADPGWPGPLPVPENAWDRIARYALVWFRRS